MSFNDIVSFFLYVIPGFISTEIYRKKYPGKKISDFAQLTWSITLSIGFFIFTRCLSTKLRLDLFPVGIGFPRVRTVLILVILAVVFAFLRIAKRELAEKYEWLKTFKAKPLSIWPFVNNDPEWACVTLSDGTKYLGWISEWTFDPNVGDQDFLLADAQKVDDELNIIYKIDGKGVYLRTSWITSIEFFKGNNLSEDGIELIIEEAAPTKD